MDKGGDTYITEGGEVREYAPGDGSGKQIGDPNLAMPEFVTVDNAGDVFVAGITPGGAEELDWLPAGANTWKNTGLTYGPVRIDKKGDLVVAQFETRFAVVSIPSFKQIRSFDCPGQGCLRFNFTEDGRELWVVDGVAISVYGISFPSGTLEDTISEGLSAVLIPTGIAVSPGLK